MKKHLLPISLLVCLIVVIGTLLYQYFEKGGVTTDGWLTLLLMISFNMTQIPYWKEYFKKNPSTFFDVIVICNGPFKIRRKFMNVQDQNMKKLLLKNCNRYIRVGYRAKNIKQFLFWEHKAEGKQLSFSTTLVEDSKQGIYKKYFKYF